MRRLIFLFLVVCLCGTAYPHGGDGVNLDVQYTDLERTVLILNNPEYSTEKVTVNNKEYLRIGLEGEGLVELEKPGFPFLPAVYRSLMVPDKAAMEVNVLNSEYTDIQDVDLISHKGMIPRTVDPATVPYRFGEVYQKDAWYPETPASLRTPYIIREVRGVVVELYPFQYNPVKKVLRVYNHLEVEVKSVGDGTQNIIEFSSQKNKPDLAFWGLYNSHFINSAGSRVDPPSENGDMLVICHGPFMSAMQPFLTHKNSVGVNTTMVDVATIGNNATAIKNHITSVYNSSNLAYVLLVGDANEIKSPSAGGGLSDPSYSLMTGDNYPDLFVGRFSATTTAHVDTQVQRTIEYEQAGHSIGMGGWNTWGMGVASNQGAGQGHYGESDDVHVGLIRNELLAYGFTKVDQIYDPSGSKSQVAAGLNEGRRVVNYCGHGSSTSWGSTGFSNSDVNNLQNVGKLPFICSVACVNGQFNNGTCFAETWMRATHNGEPTGAVGCYMSTVNQSWAPPMYGQGNHGKSNKYGAAERFWMETNWSLGGCWFGGSCCMMDLAGSGGVSEFKNWTIFGDPSLRLTSMPALFISVDQGPPKGLTPPGLAAELTLMVKDGAENLVPGSTSVHYRYDSNAAYTTVAMTPIGNDQFEAVLPNTKPGDAPEIYFSADTVQGNTITMPFDAPATVYSYEIGFAEMVMEDDFETDMGWTVKNTNISTGAFERADPMGTSAQPENDHSPNGTKCYVTGRLGGSSGDYDVDGGPTVLTSPVIDLSTGDAMLNFYVYFYHSSNGTQQPLQIHLSNNNGTTWKKVKDVGDAPNWTLHSYKVSDFVAPSANVRVKFTATDNPNDSVVEALVDDFSVMRFNYAPSLWADGYSVTASAATSVNISVEAGAAYGGRDYVILGSISGTSPGFDLPGGIHVPINWDLLTNLILNTLGSPVFQNFMGTLDGQGCAIAQFNTFGPIDPALVGEVLSYAYFLNETASGWDFASNAINMEIVP